MTMDDVRFVGSGAAIRGATTPSITVEHTSFVSCKAQTLEEVSAWALAQLRTMYPVEQGWSHYSVQMVPSSDVRLVE